MSWFDHSLWFKARNRVNFALNTKFLDETAYISKFDWPPYQFKVTFLPKILGVLTTRCETNL